MATGNDYPELKSWALSRDYDLSELTVWKKPDGRYTVLFTPTGGDYGQLFRVDVGAASTREEYFGRQMNWRLNPITHEPNLDSTNMKPEVRSVANSNNLNMTGDQAAPLFKKLASVPDSTGAHWNLNSMTRAVNWLEDAHSRAYRLTFAMPEIVERGVGIDPNFTFGTFPAGRQMFHRHRAIYYNVRARLQGVANDLLNLADATRTVMDNYARVEDRNAMTAADLARILDRAESPPTPSTGYRPSDSGASAPSASGSGGSDGRTGSGGSEPSGGGFQK